MYGRGCVAKGEYIEKANGTIHVLSVTVNAAYGCGGIRQRGGSVALPRIGNIKSQFAPGNPLQEQGRLGEAAIWDERACESGRHAPLERCFFWEMAFRKMSAGQ